MNHIFFCSFSYLQNGQILQHFYICRNKWVVSMKSAQVQTRKPVSYTGEFSHIWKFFTKTSIVQVNNGSELFYKKKSFFTFVRHSPQSIILIFLYLNIFLHSRPWIFFIHSLNFANTFHVYLSSDSVFICLLNFLYKMGNKFLNWAWYFWVYSQNTSSVQKQKWYTN